MRRPTITLMPVAQNRVMVLSPQNQIWLAICGEADPTEMEITVYTSGDKGNSRVPKRIIRIDPEGNITIKGGKIMVLVDADEKVSTDPPINDRGGANWYGGSNWCNLSTDERQKVARDCNTLNEVNIGEMR